MLKSVFVYGTLKRGHSNHRLLEDSELLLSGEVHLPVLPLDLGAFPALISNAECSYLVNGELYLVNAETLQQLDWLEGHPNFYERHLTNLKWLGNPRKHSYDYEGIYHLLSKAWVYYLKDYLKEDIENIPLTGTFSW